MAVEIKVDGDDKIFFARCFECGSDLNYRLSDVQTETPLIPADIMAYPYRHIVCPKCGTVIPAGLEIEAEFRKTLYYSAYAGSFCCNTGTESSVESTKNDV